MIDVLGAFFCPQPGLVSKLRMVRFTADRLEKLGRSLELALNQEWPQLSSTQKRLAKATPSPITRPAVLSNLVPIATVATDGGENRLRLEPIDLQIIRVADSRGEIYFEDFIAQSLTPEEILRFFFKSNERLQRFLNYLRLDWNELLPRSDFQRGHLLSMLRELMEWAALLKLANHPTPKLLIRDGLLRSVMMTEVVFQRLRERFETLTVQHGHLLVGVAKRSSVLNYLSLALGLDQRFNESNPAYLSVPRELEQQAAPAKYRWIGNRAMGQLYIGRLDRGTTVPLLPVDIAGWQVSRADEAMALLQNSARASFPLRGYPSELVQAHQHARLGGLEMELLESLLLQKIGERDPAVAHAARQLILSGKELVNAENEPLND